MVILRKRAKQPDVKDVLDQLVRDAARRITVYLHECQDDLNTQPKLVAVQNLFDLCTIEILKLDLMLQDATQPRHQAILQLISELRENLARLPLSTIATVEDPTRSPVVISVLKLLLDFHRGLK